MTRGTTRDYPRAILHIDGDAFFASCEIAKSPWLRGKPVVTGKERGIVSSASYEAKRLGITRGIPLGAVKRICPETIIIASDFELYALYSRRMYDIVRRYTPEVEEYGIDECFADLTGMCRVNRMNYEETARAIQSDLYRELSITFSLGLSGTKVLAKLGSKWQKPNGCTFIPLYDRERFLAKTPAGQVWGIGPNTAAFLAKEKVHTALALTKKEEAWVSEKLSKPVRELWHELRGESVLRLVTEKSSTPQSVQRTRTFSPSTNASFIRSELSKNIEAACYKARRQGLYATTATFFLKSQEFRYYSVDVALTRPTNIPQEILSVVEPRFLEAYRPGVRFRTTGITLHGLRNHGETQPSLFEREVVEPALAPIYEAADTLAARFGKQVVFLGSSFEARARRALLSETGVPIVRGSGKRLPLPFLGEVT